MQTYRQPRPRPRSQSPSFNPDGELFELFCEEAEAALRADERATLAEFTPRPGHGLWEEGL